MFAVIFEVHPRPGRNEDYLDIAERLRPEIEKLDGFVSLERFQSLSVEGKLLFLSFWRDAEGVRRWREQARRHLAHLSGGDEIAADYRITVVEVERQYGTVPPKPGM